MTLPTTDKTETAQTISSKTDTEQTPQLTAEKEAEQERLRRLYLQQQQRLACPGCGESPFLG